jgi:hypothetical protein
LGYALGGQTARTGKISNFAYISSVRSFTIDFNELLELFWGTSDRERQGIATRPTCKAAAKILPIPK